MHVKRRGRIACLYRSTWVKKGERNNTHGYAMQSYVGGLAADSCGIPSALAEKLTAEERAYVERTVCMPAQEAAERARAVAERTEADPVWRLAEAARLLEEAAERSHRRRVPADGVKQVADALARVNGGNAQVMPSSPRPDPLAEALTAIRTAAKLVRDGAIGSAPATGARTTTVYAIWAQLVAEIDGSANESLLGALQSRGFVKRRRG